jgi:hypothetical protein
MPSDYSRNIKDGLKRLMLWTFEDHALYVTLKRWKTQHHNQYFTTDTNLVRLQVATPKGTTPDDLRPTRQ